MLPQVHPLQKSKRTRLSYRKYIKTKVLPTNWAVVVAQSIKWLLLITEVCSSNPVIGKICIEHLFIVEKRN